MTLRPPAPGRASVLPTGSRAPVMPLSPQSYTPLDWLSKRLRMNFAPCVLGLSGAQKRPAEFPHPRHARRLPGTGWRRRQNRLPLRPVSRPGVGLRFCKRSLTPEAAAPAPRQGTPVSLRSPSAQRVSPAARSAAYRFFDGNAGLLSEAAAWILSESLAEYAEPCLCRAVRARARHCGQASIFGIGWIWDELHLEKGILAAACRASPLRSARRRAGGRKDADRGFGRGGGDRKNLRDHSGRHRLYCRAARQRGLYHTGRLRRIRALHRSGRRGRSDHRGQRRQRCGYQPGHGGAGGRQRDAEKPDLCQRGHRLVHPLHPRLFRQRRAFESNRRLHSGLLLPRQQRGLCATPEPRQHKRFRLRFQRLYLRHRAHQRCEQRPPARRHHHHLRQRRLQLRFFPALRRRRRQIAGRHEQSGVRHGDAGLRLAVRLGGRQPFRAGKHLSVRRLRPAKRGKRRGPGPEDTGGEYLHRQLYRRRLLRLFHRQRLQRHLLCPGNGGRKAPVVGQSRRRPRGEIPGGTDRA